MPSTRARLASLRKAEQATRAEIDEEVDRVIAAKQTESQGTTTAAKPLS